MPKVPPAIRKLMFNKTPGRRTLTDSEFKALAKFGCKLVEAANKSYERMKAREARQRPPVIASPDRTENNKSEPAEKQPPPRRARIRRAKKNP